MTSFNYNEKTQLVHSKCNSLVPVFYNLVFAYSLLEKNETRKQGVSLLHRMLGFQKGEGGFPEYIHLFPFSSSLETQVNICVVLSQIVNLLPLFTPFFDNALEFLGSGYRDSIERDCFIDLLSGKSINKQSLKGITSEEQLSSLALISTTLDKKSVDFEMVMQHILSRYEPKNHLFFPSSIRKFQEGKPSTTIFSSLLSKYFRQDSCPQEIASPHIFVKEHLDTSILDCSKSFSTLSDSYFLNYQENNKCISIESKTSSLQVIAPSNDMLEYSIDNGTVSITVCIPPYTGKFMHQDCLQLFINNKKLQIMINGMSTMVAQAENDFFLFSDTPQFKLSFSAENSDGTKCAAYAHLLRGNRKGAVEESSNISHYDSIIGIKRLHCDKEIVITLKITPFH